mmetsp:Transcript_124257/g.337488  ORF Transcript_124257/g.337488 Transcript_124257/m.337488 type:complete len:285 (-) Transcript_124257:519-1373(-)
MSGIHPVAYHSWPSMPASPRPSPARVAFGGELVPTSSTRARPAPSSRARATPRDRRLPPTMTRKARRRAVAGLSLCCGSSVGFRPTSWSNATRSRQHSGARMHGPGPRSTETDRGRGPLVAMLLFPWMTFSPMAAIRWASSSLKGECMVILSGSQRSAVTATAVRGSCRNAAVTDRSWSACTVAGPQPGWNATIGMSLPLLCHCDRQWRKSAGSRQPVLLAKVGLISSRNAFTGSHVSGCIMLFQRTPGSFGDHHSFNLPVYEMSTPHSSKASGGANCSAKVDG